MTPTPGAFLDLLILKEFKFNNLELQILQGLGADFLELRITKELLRFEVRAKGGAELGGEFRTVDWRNTEKDSTCVTLFQLITEQYSNGLWKSTGVTCRCSPKRRVPTRNTGIGGTRSCPLKKSGPPALCPSVDLLPFKTLTKLEIERWFESPASPRRCRKRGVR